MLVKKILSIIDPSEFYYNYKLPHWCNTSTYMRGNDYMLLNANFPTCKVLTCLFRGKMALIISFYLEPVIFALIFNYFWYSYYEA